MKYIVEESLSNFKFWSGAVRNAEKLTTEELDRVESYFPDLFGEDSYPTDVQINDMFWFEFDTICEWLGLDPDELEERE